MPQILGELRPELPVSVNESIQPSVVVVAGVSLVVDGPTMAKTSKSSLKKTMLKVQSLTIFVPDVTNVRAAFFDGVGQPSSSAVRIQ